MRQGVRGALNEGMLCYPVEDGRSSSDSHRLSCSIKPRLHSIQSFHYQGRSLQTDTGPAPRVGVVLTHRTANFLSNIAIRELSKRGLLVLALNPGFENNEAAVIWDEIALDINPA
jgi:hypothetical protein